MIKIEILGARANWSKPFRAKNIKNFTSCFFETDDRFQIDAGNSWDKRKIDYLILTHLHKDHIAKIKTYPREITYLLPTEKFLKALPKNSKKVIFKRKTLVGKTKIVSFKVHHSLKTETFGYKIFYKGTSFLWLPDFFAPFDYSSLGGCDVWFLGASSFKRNIAHSQFLSGHRSILNSLQEFKRRKIFPKKKRIYLVHLGLSMFPLKKRILFLKEKFPEFEILPAFDGMRVEIG
jgi:ribonuclease BN (tRNA processing enzyme)